MNLQVAEKRFTKEAKETYFRLTKEGYFIRPEKFKNTTVYSICKNDNEEGTERTVYGEVNKEMALILKSIFGFKIVKPVPYFGKAKPVDKFMIRYQ